MFSGHKKEYMHAFLLESPESVDRCAKTFLSYYDDNTTVYYGRLFGFALTKNCGPKSQQILHRLIDSIQNYYAKQIHLSQTQLLNTDIETLFEKALAQTNDELKEFAYDIDSRQALKHLHAIVGIVKGEKLILSTIGYVKGFVLRNTKPISKSQNPFIQKDGEYKMINVIDDSEVTLGKFSSIISGDIYKQDKLFFCNPELLDIITLEDMKNHVSTLPIISASHKLLEHVEENHDIPYAGILIDVSLQPSLNKKKMKNIAFSTSASMSHLNQTEDQTKRVLFPSFSFSQFTKQVKTGASQLKDLYIKTKNASQASQAQTANAQATDISLSSEITTAKKSPKRFIQQTKQVAQNTLHSSARIISNQKQWALPLLRNRYIWLCLAILVVSSFGLNLMRGEQKQEIIAQQDFSSELSQIEQHLNIAQSRLIYGDDSKARESLHLASNILDQLSSQTLHSFQTQFDQLIFTYQELSEKVNYQTTVSNPSLLIDFQEHFPHQTFTLSGILLSSQDVFAFTCHDIYQFPKRGNAQPKKIYSNPEFCIKSAKPYQDKFIMLSTSNTFAFFDPTQQKLTPLPASISQTERISDFSTFGSNVYYLDQNNNQIYKLRITNTALTDKQSWLKRDYPLSLAHSLTIDGSIYILLSNGNIQKFYLGNRQESFDFKNTLFPTLTYPVKIMTVPDDSYTKLFVLEPKHQRVLAINKETGSFLAQYHFPTLSQITDMSIDFDSNTLYIQNDTSIYQYSLPQ